MLNSADIALKIKGLLKSRNISASKLLADCGLNKNALVIWQSSEYAPRLEAITAIADYLDCSVDYLLGRTDNPHAHKPEEPTTQPEPKRISSEELARRITQILDGTDTTDQK